MIHKAIYQQIILRRIFTVLLSMKYYQLLQSESVVSSSDSWDDVGCMARSQEIAARRRSSATLRTERAPETTKQGAKRARLLSKKIYTFDAYNRATERETKNGTVTKDRVYTYDDTNRLTRIDDSVSAGTPITYTYDANGNTIKKSDSSGETVFAYDVRNQLTQVNKGASILGQYDYNAQGMRIRHRNSERGDVDYYYDEKSIIEEHDASTGNLLARYRYGDRLLSLDTGSSVQYYHHDALGSTVNLTTQGGAVQVSYTLDPWGHIRNQLGSSVNRHIFTDQETDERTGLIYFGARYYDPDTARFITEDPYQGENTTPPSLNRYLYAYSNPTVWVDLEGYESNRQILGIDDESANKTLARDNSTSTILALTAKSTLYTIWNGLTGGFVKRQDEREEKYDRGEITRKQYWTGTGIDAGVSVVSQAVGGKIGSVVGGKVATALGSKFAGAVASGGAMSGSTSLVEQSGEVITYHATEGKLGQERIDFGQVLESVGSGMVMGGALYGAEKLIGALKSQPQMTVENAAGSAVANATGRAEQAVGDAIGNKLPAKYDPEFAEKQLHRLAEKNINDSETTVLGLYDPPPGYMQYIDKAKSYIVDKMTKQRGASYFDIGDTWNALTSQQRGVANQHFLDVIANKGDKVILSVPKSVSGRGVSLSKELEYLENQYNFKWVNQWSLRRK